MNTALWDTFSIKFLIIESCILANESQVGCFLLLILLVWKLLIKDHMLLIWSCFWNFQIAMLLPLQKNYEKLKSQFELKSYDLSLFQSRAEQNEHHKVVILLPCMFHY